MTPLSTAAASTSVADAQKDMRVAWYGGAPGMYASATVWMIAGAVALLVSARSAVWALFIGGMLIHPIGVLLTRVLGRSARHAASNPLGLFALEGTVWLVLCMPLAYVVSLYRIEWFFPAMLFVIGGRYFTFSTMFGSRRYWACGAALALAGYVLGRANAAPELSAFAGAAIEAAFATAIFIAARREMAA